jgi:hypothetical protein
VLWQPIHACWVSDLRSLLTGNFCLRLTIEDPTTRIVHVHRDDGLICNYIPIVLYGFVYSFSSLVSALQQKQTICCNIYRCLKVSYLCWSFAGQILWWFPDGRRVDKKRWTSYWAFQKMTRKALPWPGTHLGYGVAWNLTVWTKMIPGQQKILDICHRDQGLNRGDPRTCSKHPWTDPHECCVEWGALSLVANPVLVLLRSVGN